MQRLIEEGVHPAVDNSYQGKVPQKYREVVVEEFNHDYEQCKSIDQNKRDESSDWARVAAEGGDFLGLEMLTRDPNISTKERIALYEKIWSDFGSLESAINLSNILSGVGNHASYSLVAGLEPNPKKAYAYFLASSNIEVAVSERFNPQDTAQLQYELSIFEQLLTSKLTAREHLEAEQLAIELIESNENCCTIDTSFTHQIGPAQSN